jgi:hypothetical protein
MNHLSVEKLLDNVEQNKEWIRGEGKDHWLASCWKIMHQQSAIFVKTSCEITAATIRWRAGLGDEWSLVDGGHTFEGIEKKSKYFQISIGEDWTSWEHIVTIWNGYLVQSYYGKYGIKSLPITAEIKEAFDNISGPGNYAKITGIECGHHDDLKVFYWLPPV